MTGPGRYHARPQRPWTPRLWPGSVLATRKPLLLFRLPGSFLLRLVERRFLGLLFQEPPRSTRAGQGTGQAPREGSKTPPRKRVWRSRTVSAKRA